MKNSNSNSNPQVPLKPFVSSEHWDLESFVKSLEHILVVVLIAQLDVFLVFLIHVFSHFVTFLRIFSFIIAKAPVIPCKFKFKLLISPVKGIEYKVIWKI